MLGDYVHFHTNNQPIGSNSANSEGSEGLANDAKAVVAALGSSEIPLYSGPPVLIPGIDWPQGYLFHSDPMAHQRHAWEMSAASQQFALFMEQGTGKTKVLIDTGAANFEAGQLSTIIVVTDNDLHRAWLDTEVPKHMPPRIPLNPIVWNSGKAGTLTYRRQWAAWLKTPLTTLAIASFNIESIMVAKVQKLISDIVAQRRVLFILDESTSAKAHHIKRTKMLIKLMSKAYMRRIATGIPAPESPLNLYSQMQCLHPSFWREGSWFTFKHTYGEWETRENKHAKNPYQKTYEVQKQALDVDTGLMRPVYRNLDALMAQVAPYSYRVMKDECLDLPPKVFQTVPFAMSKEQELLYTQLTERGTMELGVDHELRMYISRAMTRQMRLLQITSGFVVAPDVELDEDGEPMQVWYKPRPLKENPRLESMLSLLEKLPEHRKAIIWSRFNYDIDVIQQALASRYGHESVVQYDGRVDADSKVYARQAFQADPKVRWFNAKGKSAGKGLTLTAADYMIFYSHEAGLERRLQCEDRAHRIGQKNQLTIASLAAEQSWDPAFIALRWSKYNSMEQLLSSVPRELWGSLARGGMW